MEIVRIPVTDVELNTGQIEGLPANPRQWTRDDIDRIAKSLKETPELFEMRPCIVFPNEDKYILLAGNLRFSGARANGDKDVPCVVVPADTPIDKLKEYVIKDNGAFGFWDYDSLANEWDDLPLSDWGVPRIPNTDDVQDVDDFTERMSKITNENALYPIIPEFDEDAECFIIIARTETDANWLREKLNMQKMKSCKEDKTTKSNVISIEDLKDVL